MSPSHPVHAKCRQRSIANALWISLSLAFGAHLVGITAQGVKMKTKKPDMQNRGSGTVIRWTFALSLSPFMFLRKIMCLNHGLNCGSFPSPSIQRLKMSLHDLHDLHVCLGFCRKQNANNSAGHVFCVSSWLFLIMTSATWAKVRRWDSRCPKTNSVEVPGSLGSLSNLVVSMCPSGVTFSVGVSKKSWSNAKEKGKLVNVWKKNMEPLSCSCFSVSLCFWVPRPLCRKQCLASAPPTRMLCNWCHHQFHSAKSQPEVDHLSDLNPFCNVRWNHRWFATPIAAPRLGDWGSGGPDNPKCCTHQTTRKPPGIQQTQKEY